MMGIKRKQKDPSLIQKKLLLMQFVRIIIIQEQERRNVCVCVSERERDRIGEG